VDTHLRTGDLLPSEDLWASPQFVFCINRYRHDSRVVFNRNNQSPWLGGSMSFVCTFVGCKRGLPRSSLHFDTHVCMKRALRSTSYSYVLRRALTYHCSEYNARILGAKTNTTC